MMELSKKNVQPDFPKNNLLPKALAHVTDGIFAMQLGNAIEPAFSQKPWWVWHSSRGCPSKYLLPHRCQYSSRCMGPYKDIYTGKRKNNLMGLDVEGFSDPRNCCWMAFRWKLGGTGGSHEDGKRCIPRFVEHEAASIPWPKKPNWSSNFGQSNENRNPR